MQKIKNAAVFSKVKRFLIFPVLNQCIIIKNNIELMGLQTDLKIKNAELQVSIYKLRIY